MGSADEGVMPQQRSEELSHRVARRSFYIVIHSLAPRRPPGPTPRGRQILGRPIIASTRRKWLPPVGPFRAVRGLNSQLYKPKHYRTTPHTRDTLERGLRLSLALLLHWRYTHTQSDRHSLALRRGGVLRARPRLLQSKEQCKASSGSRHRRWARRP